jgi:hypothetical protein
MTWMQPTSGPPAGPTAEPGERRRLDRPPSDRYTAGPEPDAAAAAAASTLDDATPAPIPQRERVLRGVAVGLAGVIAFTILGGPLSVTVGLVAVAGVIGWVTGMVVGPGRALAVTLAVASVTLGLVGIWLFAGFEGGALNLVAYLAEVQGILVPFELLVAGGLAAAAS